MPKLISVDSRILKVILIICIKRTLLYFFFSVHVCVKKLCSTALILYIVLNANLSLKGSVSIGNRWTLLPAGLMEVRGAVFVDEVGKCSC